MAVGKHFCCICHTYCKLKMHLKKCHPEYSPEEYYDSFLRKDGEGICWYCGQPTIINWKNMEYNKFCSQECLLKMRGRTSSKRMKGLWDEDEGFRKRMTESSSIRLKEQWKNPEFQELQSKKKHNELLVQWQDEEYRQFQSNLMSSRMKEMWKNEEHREFMIGVVSRTMSKTWEDETFQKEASERATKRLKDPDDDFGKTKVYYYNDLILRSQLELQFAIFLDANNINYKYEIPFSYTKQNGSPGTYLVDFYLPTYGVYIEIKGGYWGVETEDYKIQCLRDKGLQVTKLVGKQQINEYCKTLKGE